MPHGTTLTSYYAATAVALVLLAAAPASAERGLSFSVGGGVTADPKAGLIVLELPFGLTDSISIGPHVQFVIDGDVLLVAPTGLLRFTIGNLGALRTFFQGGMGVAHISGDVPDQESKFLMNVGIGAEVPVGRGFSLRTSAIANIIPSGAGGDEFFFSWEALALRYRF